jgi:hypothetical protein
MGLWIEESHTNEDKNYLMGEPYEYETFADTPGELFRSILKDGWRCTSSVYIDKEPPARVGWYFQKTDRYEDTNQPFKHGMWVTLLTKPTTVIRQRHVMEI